MYETSTKMKMEELGQRKSNSKQQTLMLLADSYCLLLLIRVAEMASLTPPRPLGKNVSPE
jgi:hypothetical protein